MRRRPFTLIEVLIAGGIMSTVILLVTQAQRQNNLISNKIIEMQKRSEASLFIKKLITGDLIEGKKTGTGKWGEWEFEWNTRLVSSKTSRKNIAVPGQRRFNIKLYEINFTLTKDGKEFEESFFKTVF